MTIAIDIDGTWTNDEDFWADFCALAKRCGHEVFIATGRSRWSFDMAGMKIPKDVNILYCGIGLKADAVKAMGVKIDVWIDNEPGTIEQCRKPIESPDDEL